MALGLLADNGVVIAEDIRQRLDRGEQRLNASLAAAQSPAIPLLTRSLTTIIAFLPLALFGGEFRHGMAIVIMCGLGVGTLLTPGFIPVLYSLMFRKTRRYA